MNRGDFLKLSCTGCMLSAAGLMTISALLDGCSPKSGMAVYKTTVVNKLVQVPLAQIPAGKITIVRGKGMEYDIAVRPVEEGRYEALLLRCTHFSNPLTVEGNGYSCSLHGSQFSVGGDVKKGPASQPLQKLKCEVATGTLLIHV